MIIQQLSPSHRELSEQLTLLSKTVNFGEPREDT